MVSLFFSAVALIVSTVGMKCTHFMDNLPEIKSKVAVSGGVLFLLAGEPFIIQYNASNDISFVILYFVAFFLIISHAAGC